MNQASSNHCSRWGRRFLFSIAIVTSATTAAVGVAAAAPPTSKPALAQRPTTTVPRPAAPTAGQVFSAVVNRDGTFLHGAHVSRVDHWAAGSYDVYFDDPMAAWCTNVASIADAGKAGLTIRNYGGVVANNVVRVETGFMQWDSYGGTYNASDATFQLILAC